MVMASKIYAPITSAPAPKQNAVPDVVIGGIFSHVVHCYFVTVMAALISVPFYAMPTSLPFL